MNGVVRKVVIFTQKLYIIYCIYSINCIQYNILCTVYILHSVQCTLYCTLYSVHLMVRFGTCGAQLKYVGLVYPSLCLHYKLYTIYYILLYSVLCIYNGEMLKIEDCEVV